MIERNDEVERKAESNIVIIKGERKEKLDGEIPLSCRA